MNIGDFVDETLSEILSGIRAAQKKEGGGAIGAGGLSLPATKELLLVSGSDGLYTAVEFDVSVVVETAGGGKGALKVWSVGSVEAGGKRSDQQTSRVRFAVHLKIPRGDEAPRFK